MVAGTLSLIQKGQTSGCSTHGGGDMHKVKPVDTVDAVRSGCSRIVVYGGGHCL